MGKKIIINGVTYSSLIEFIKTVEPNKRPNENNLNYYRRVLNTYCPDRLEKHRKISNICYHYKMEYKILAKIDVF